MRIKKSVDIKRYLTVAVLFIISIFSLSGYLAYKKLTLELASAFSSNSFDIVNEEIFTVAYITVDDLNEDPLLAKSINFKIFDRNNLKVIEYNIPVNIKIDAPGRYGEEPMANILDLGNLQSKDGQREGAEILSRALSKLMAFPINKYLVVEESESGFFNSLFNGNLDLVGRTSDFSKMKDSVITNLSLRELFNIYTFVNTLTEDRVIHKDLTQTYLDNPNILDEELMDLTFDSDISNEKKSIAVLNGSDIPGVANYGSRIVKNVGGRVVSISNTKEPYAKSILIVDDLTTQSTRIIKNIFNIDRVILKTDAGNLPENEIERADVIIIFGLDFATSL